MSNIELFQGQELEVSELDQVAGGGFFSGLLSGFGGGGRKSYTYNTSFTVSGTGNTVVGGNFTINNPAPTPAPAPAV